MRIMTSNWCIFRLLVLLLKTSLIINYPITSEPLANNPEHWGESSWIVYEHKNSSLPYKSPINSSKVKKITAKSIFITPDFIMQNSLKECQSGFRIDDNGKCIKIVNINKDDIIASQLQHIFSGTVTNEDNYDYGDYEDGNDSAKVDTKPIRFNLSIDPPSDTNEKPLIKQEQYLVEVIKKPSSLAVESATSMESVVSTMSYQSAHKFKEETITESLVESTTIFDKISKQMTATELFETTTEHIMQTPKSPSFQIQANRTKLMLLNKTRQIFVPKSQRQRTTIKTKPTGYISKLHNTKPSKIISYPGLKIPPKPFAWLPKGWKIDQNAPSPMLIKFWSEMPLVQDGFLLTTSSSKDTTSYKKLKHQRINSRRPQKNVLKEVTSIELKKQFHKF